MAEFLALINAGGIVNETDFRRVLARLRDGHYVMKITAKRQRSLSQNAYFHGVVLPLVFEGLRDAGFDDVDDEETAKMVVKNLFAKKWIHNADGVGIEYVQDTHKMTTVEFSEFIDKIIKFGVEFLGIQIPYPNEYLKNWGLEK